jgi:hypothetical protein
MTFPTANSVMIYNEDGEVLGWDTYRDDFPEYDPDDYLAGDYDEPDEIAPEDCDHNDVDDVVDFAPGISQGTCSWCFSRVYALDVPAEDDYYHFSLTVPSPF